MSMNRFVGLGIFALSSSVFLTLGACDDSATPPAINGTAQGGTSQTSGASSNNSSDSSSTDKDTSKGGNSSSTSKSSSTKGGSSSTKTSDTSSGEDGGTSSDTTENTDPEGGSSGGSGECELGTTDLAAAAADSTDGNWVGGDDTTADDNPCGFQGAFYAYSDAGADEVQGNEDDTLDFPAFKSGTEYENPCTGGKCCIRGETVKWPAKEVYTTWGAGLGLSLNDGGGDVGKSAYSGPAKGFKLTLSGDLGGNTLRMGLTQSATDEAAPFSTTTTLDGEKVLMFTGPACPSWADTCIDPGETPYDLQLQVAGGDSAGAFEVCVEKLIPIESE